MTTVYFIRHAESDKRIRDGRIRPLTEKGERDAHSLVNRLCGVHFDRFYSSPFKRAVDTVVPLAASRGMEIIRVEDFRERRSDSVQTIPMPELLARQWSDFSFTLSDGECFAGVQRRNLTALHKLLAEEEGNTVAVGTHGVAMCTVLHSFAPISWEHFSEILQIMPYLVRVTFNGSAFQSMEELSQANLGATSPQAYPNPITTAF